MPSLNKAYLILSFFKTSVISGLSEPRSTNHHCSNSLTILDVIFNNIYFHSFREQCISLNDAKVLQYHIQINNGQIVIIIHVAQNEEDMQKFNVTKLKLRTIELSNLSFAYLINLLQELLPVIIETQLHASFVLQLD